MGSVELKGSPNKLYLVEHTQNFLTGFYLAH